MTVYRLPPKPTLGPPSDEPQAHYLDRTRLAYQYRRGEGLDDDTDLSQSFQVHSYALGSTRTESGALKFMKGFGLPTDTAHSRLNFNMDKMWIYVYAIPTKFLATPPAFIPLEVEIPFEDIVTGGVRVIRAPRKGDDQSLVTLTVTTRRPARFYLPINNRIARRATERDFVFSLGPQESIPGRSVPEMKAKGYIIHEGHAGPIEAVAEDPLTVQVNAWLTWQFEFMLGPRERQEFRQKIIDLGIVGREEGMDLLAHAGEKKIKVVPPEIMAHVNPNAVLQGMDFRLRYLVEGLVTHGIVVQTEIPQLVHALDKMCESAQLKERVVTALFNEERVRDIKGIIMVRARQLRKRRLKVDPHLVEVYKCRVTPTRICLFPPELDSSNDALRKHNEHSDRFLRVHFADEDDRIQINLAVLEADAEKPYTGPIARVRRALASGIVIAGRHYVFLVYGASSAREHTCWFVAEDEGENFTAEVIRARLGFDQITHKIVAKHAAYMGLPFSATRAVGIEVDIRSKIPDVKEKGTGVLYTDGVGRCGYKVARQAAREFGILNGVDAQPSAIQIRCGGIKGVLCVCPPEMCRPSDVFFRPSQIKFDSASSKQKYSLSVVRVAQFRRAFLNRQFTLLLSHLGVDDKVFRQLYNEAIEATRGLSTRFVEGRPTERDLRAGVGLCAVRLKELGAAGFNHNPFLIDVCKVLETRLLSNVKWKARIELKKGVYLMGVADEFGVLKEGEVFCQYENPADPVEGPVVVKGPCAIMRAPAHNPGDIQIVNAVDHEKLRDLKNVIVFSVRGKPLPHMLSGGDLDGDDYSLIWDPRLLPKLREEPAAYDAVKPFTVNKVTIEHIKSFFIDYIKNDILGQVSNAHLAHADRVGPHTEVCRTLANQASIAVDFPKTGMPAKMEPQWRPRRWPHFMGKELQGFSKNNYVSRRILGQLFDLVSPNPSFQRVDIRQLSDEEIVDERIARYEVPPSVLDDAYQLKQDYDSKVIGLMKRYRITEAETVGGIVLLNPRRRGHREDDLRDPVEQNYRTLANNVLDVVDKFLSKRKFKAALTGRQIYAIAAYQITYVKPVIKAVEERLGVKDPLAEMLDATSLSNGTSVTPTPATVTPAESVNGDSSSVNGDAPPIIPPLPVLGPAPMISFPWVFWESLCDLPNVKEPPQGNGLPN